MTRMLIVAGLGAVLAAPTCYAIEFSGLDLNGRPCTGEHQGFGPFDYTNPQQVKKHLPIVEAYHFTPEVESLQAGKSGHVIGDLDYTLRAFPNHHRALFALIRLASDPSLRSRKGMGQITTPPECYLQRAERFQPKDSAVQVLYGLYLHRLGKLEDAESHYRTAIRLEPRSSEAYYNLGLLLVDEERYVEAGPIARKAYELGYPLAGLRKRLADAGHPLK